MPLTAIPDELFLPFEAVRLGRLVKSIDQPFEGNCEPSFAEIPKPIVSEFEYDSCSKNGSIASFGSTLTSLLSAAFSKRSQSETRVEPTLCKGYALDNSDAWFDRAIDLEETKKWLERAAVRGNKVCMIVGFCTLTDTSFFQTSVRERELKGQVTAPASLSLAAAGTVAPLAGLVDPCMHGNFDSFADSGTRIFAPGEKICAIRYRRIVYTWFSSRATNNMQLSKTRQWSCMEGGTRDAYAEQEEDDEDMIEVDLGDAENIGGGWDATASEQDLIYIRASK